MEPEPGQSDGAGFPNLDLLLLFSALNPAIAANEQKLSNEKILFHHKSLSTQSLDRCLLKITLSLIQQLTLMNVNNRLNKMHFMSLT